MDISKDCTLLQSINDAAQDAIILIDHNGRITGWNGVAQAIFGYSRSEALGREAHELLAPVSYHGASRSAFEVFRRTGTGPIVGTTRELTAKGKDGREFPIELSVSAADVNGKWNAVGIVRDISEQKSIELALREAESKFRNLVEQSLVGVYIIQNGRFAYVNPRLAEIFGYSQEEMIGPMGNMDVTHPEDRPAVAENIKKRIRGRIESIHYGFRGVKKDGSVIDVEVYGSCTEFQGKPAVIGTLLDVTERRLAQAALKESEERFHGLTELTSDWYWEQDANFRFTLMSGGITATTGIAADNYLGKTRWEIPYFGVSRKELEEHNALLDARQPFYDLVFKRLNSDGEVRHISLSGRPIFDEHGNFRGYRGVGRDITQRQRAEEQIRHLAHYDALTGLPNRMLLQDRLHRAILDARRRDRMVGVLQVDLDRFKYINDTMGHQVGDILLETVAERVRSCIRQGDTVARQGGDEFSILLEALSQAQDAGFVAEKILVALSEPIRVDGQDFVVTASIGISLYPHDGADVQSLLMNSEAAMYHAKNEGRNTIQFFAAEMNSMARERLALEKDLRLALEKQEFLLHYQPQVDFGSGRIIGVETLIRWRHPQLGMVSPAKFIPLAEDTGLIIPIGDWVLRTACAQTRAWHDAGFRHLQVSVNLSARQFKQQNLSQAVRQVISETGLLPEFLELELTESILVQNPERAIATLHEMKAMGVRFSVDDFGTGYSSLSYLKRFPLDKLKIDQSFVRDISTDPSDAAITQAVIALGRSLGLQVIAEGVETADQLRFLFQNGCHGMQGYYFSKPLPAEQFAELLVEGRCLDLPKST